MSKKAHCTKIQLFVQTSSNKSKQMEMLLSNHRPRRTGRLIAQEDHCKDWFQTWIFDQLYHRRGSKQLFQELQKF